MQVILCNWAQHVAVRNYIKDFFPAGQRINKGRIYTMIIKPMRLVLGLGLIIVTLAGCSFISVDTEYDPAINFADYHTFKWMPQTDRTGRDPLVDSSLFIFA